MTDGSMTCRTKGKRKKWGAKQISCFYFFEGLSKEDRDALGIKLVDGDGPGCDAQYDQLPLSIDEANAVAAER